MSCSAAPATSVERIGAAGDQIIRGGDFNDTLSGLGGGDTLAGRGGDDLLIGGLDDDKLIGGGGEDTLRGGGGDDRLVVTTGRDVITGNAGADAFVLSDNLDNAERAQITDFLSGTDRFEIDADDFGGGLTAGALDPDSFRANPSGTAKDADDRFIYDTDNGKLFYDADGTGSGEAVLLARLGGAPAIDVGDFLVI